MKNVLFFAVALLFVACGDNWIVPGEQPGSEVVDSDGGSPRYPRLPGEGPGGLLPEEEVDAGETPDADAGDVGCPIGEPEEDGGVVTPPEEDAGTPPEVDAGSNECEGKVDICHIPKGKPSNLHTINVSCHAVPAHLAHGDYLGSCQ